MPEADAEQHFRSSITAHSGSGGHWRSRSTFKRIQSNFSGRICLWMLSSSSALASIVLERSVEWWSCVHLVLPSMELLEKFFYCFIILRLARPCLVKRMCLCVGLINLTMFRVFFMLTLRQSPRSEQTSTGLQSLAFQNYFLLDKRPNV